MQNTESNTQSEHWPEQLMRDFQSVLVARNLDFQPSRSFSSASNTAELMQGGPSTSRAAEVEEEDSSDRATNNTAPVITKEQILSFMKIFETLFFKSMQVF